MLATQYDDEVEATLSWVVELEVTGTASTGEVETERRRTRRVRNSAAAEKVTMMMRLFVLKYWYRLGKVEAKDLRSEDISEPALGYGNNDQRDTKMIVGW